MNSAIRTSPGWAEAQFLPRRHAAPRAVVIAGINRSDVVDAALADPILGERVIPQLEPDCAAPCDALLWRCETAAGEPLNHAAVLRRYWHRPPFAMTIRLVEYQPGSCTPAVLDEGTLGTCGPRAGLRTALERLAMRFVRDAALGRGRGAAGTAPAAVATGQGGWLDYQRARWRSRVKVEWWSLGSAAASVESLLAGNGLGEIRWHSPEAGERYLADPFPWPGTGQILCEDMPTRGGIGRIIALDPASGRTRVLLDDGAHHSYPCTFADGADLYCVPEATGRGMTRIYRLHADGALEPAADPAPHLRLADPTLFRHGGLCWLACTDLDVGSHDNLCLLHAPSPAGPWTPHRRWPVKIDIRSARPAGAVFTYRGRLLRPAQDCAATYGAAVAINEIRTLTETDFQEVPVVVLRPDRNGPFPHGLHTLAHDGERFWVDGKRFVFDPGLAGRKFLSRAARRLAAAEAE